MDNRTYRFNAESNYQSVFDQIRQSAQQLGREILEEGKSITANSKELLAYYESQITAIEKQNKLYQQQREIASQGKLQRVLDDTENPSKIAEARKVYSRESNELRLEKKEESLFVETLEELIETIKDEGRESRKETKDSSDVLVNSLDDERTKLSPEEMIAKTVRQTTDEGDKKEVEDEGKEKGRFVNKLDRLASQQNELGVVSILAGSAVGSAAGTAAGGFVSNLLSRFFGGGQELEQQLGRMEAVTGIRDIISIMGPSKFGYDNIQALQLQSNIAKSAKTSRGSAETAMDVMATVRGYDVEEGDLTSQIKSSRRDKDYSFASSIVLLDKLLTQSGAVTGKDKSLFTEFIDIQRQLVEQQSKSLERVSSTTASQIIQAFSKVGGSFGDPATMGERIATVNQSLSNPSNDFQSALSFSVLRQINPNASFVDLMKMRQSGINQPEYMSRYLDILHQQSGGNQDFFELLINSYLLGGNQYQQAETLATSYMDPSTRKMFGQMGKGTKEKVSERDASGILRERGERMTGDIIEDSAVVRNTISKIGNEAVNAVTDFVNAIGKASSALGTFGGIFKNDGN